MKMDFSKDELAMVYQYAAGTKDNTLAGLKEIVPVIRDRQTREIAVSYTHLMMLIVSAKKKM